MVDDFRVSTLRDSFPLCIGSTTGERSLSDVVTDLRPPSTGDGPKINTTGDFPIESR